MKIQAIKNYYSPKILTSQKSASNSINGSLKTQEPPRFRGGGQPQISGIGEEFFTALMKNAVSQKEIDKIKKENLLIDGKFSPELAMLFVQTFNYGADRRKKDSPGMSLENKNAFANQFAQNVFFASRDKNNKYNFSNFQESLNIIYEVQKSGKIDDMFGFIFCSKDEQNEKFEPDMARVMYKIMTEGEFNSPIDVRFYIDDFCTDLDGYISEANVDSLIELMKVVGPEHINAFAPHVYNKETNEFVEEPIQAIEYMFDYFFSDECSNKNYNGFSVDVAKFIFVMLTICKNPETKFLDAEIFNSYFQDIRLSAHGDFQKMLKKLLRQDEEF